MMTMNDIDLVDSGILKYQQACSVRSLRPKLTTLGRLLILLVNSNHHLLLSNDSCYWTTLITCIRKQTNHSPPAQTS